MGKIYRFYNLFDLNEFDKVGAPDTTQDFDLQDDGFITARLYKGFEYAVSVNGYVLTPKLNDRNPFVSKDGKMAAYIDDNRIFQIGFYADKL
jgi:hypothetical protein